MDADEGVTADDCCLKERESGAGDGCLGGRGGVGRRGDVEEEVGDDIDTDDEGFLFGLGPRRVP